MGNFTSTARDKPTIRPSMKLIPLHKTGHFNLPTIDDKKWATEDVTGPLVTFRSEGCYSYYSVDEFDNIQTAASVAIFLELKDANRKHANRKHEREFMDTLGELYETERQLVVKSRTGSLRLRVDKVEHYNFLIRRLFQLNAIVQ